MSVLSEIVANLKDQLNGETETVAHPCNNCESDCRVCPEACAECKPYKEKLVDALYNVEHIDDFYSKYEVVTEESAPAGTTVCPYCNAPATGAVCEYCGSRLAESSGKIQVKSANDIPNPVIEARDLIYARRAVIVKYATGSTSGSDSDSILGTLVSALTGGSSEKNTLGNAMTEAEIEAMAKTYDVSVHDYLEGLDTGTYLSKPIYEKQASEASSSSAGMAAGAAGAVGLGSALAGLFGRDSDGSGFYNHRPDDDRRPEPPSFGNGNQGQPSFGNGNQGQPSFGNGKDPRQGGNRPGHPGGGFGNGEGHGGGGRGDSGHGGGGHGPGGGPGGMGGRNGR